MIEWRNGWNEWTMEWKDSGNHRKSGYRNEQCSVDYAIGKGLHVISISNFVRVFMQNWFLLIFSFIDFYTILE